MLVNLVWLDLSFNNIEVIEGLDNLTKLEDLTLYNNHITHIENMDNLHSLQILSIGNNDLKELENLLYLRRFKSLRSLNLNHNPICLNEEYKIYVGAFLPQLDFLDYRLLDDQTKAIAYEKHGLQVDTLTDDEKKSQEKLEEEEEKANILAEHERAYVENLDGSTLFESMYADDPDGRLLNEMPDVPDILVIFRTNFTEICQKMFNLGLQEKKKRDDEIALFWECVNEAKAENKAEGRKALEEFNLKKQKTFKELSVMLDPKLVQITVDEYNARVSELWDKLMGLELQLLDQLEEVIQTFGRNMQDLVLGFIENLQGYMSFAREAESIHNERMLELIHITSDRVAKSELDEDEISDELRILFFDKDSVTSALQSSHDAHLQKIDNKEDDIFKRINTWQQNMMKAIHREEEIDRNRRKVIEINHIIDHFRDEIDNLEMMGGL